MFVFGDFMVRIFPYSDWILVSPNAGKYGPEKPRIKTLFTQWYTNECLGPYQIFMMELVKVGNCFRKTLQHSCFSGY